jgi:hypothetical protein
VPQPEYVPVPATDEVRPVERLPAPRRWISNRPADVHGQSRGGPGRGVPGPDQGYALTLAKRFEGRLELSSGENEHDAMAGCLGVALKRAALFGRAPVVHDLELAFIIWGFAGEAPKDLVAFRRPLFQGAAHHYWDQRMIADRVPEETLRLAPMDAYERLGSWPQLFDQTESRTA